MTELTRNTVEKQIRDGQAFERADLRGLKLDGAALAGANLQRSELDGVDLRGANLRASDLRGTSLRETILAEGKLQESCLAGADLDGADLSGADLSKADLSRANLAGANLTGANLRGANLHGAQLDGACLARADVSEASFSHADMVEADLGGIHGRKARFVRARLEKAILEESELTGARFEFASLEGARLWRANLGQANLADANLGQADLREAKLGSADLRRARLVEIQREGLVLTGAKVHGLEFDGQLDDVVVQWVDGGETSPMKVRGTDVATVLTGAKPQPRGDSRYLGAGDRLTGAELTVDPGASIRIESRLERCTLRLSDDSELVVGEEGILDDCVIHGGSVVIHGRFLQGREPGLHGPASLAVSATGQIRATVLQPTGGTRFGFESGSRLRLDIKDPK